MSLPEEEVTRRLTVCRWSFTRKLMCDPGLPSDIADALWEGPDELLIPSATPLQVKDRCVVVRYDHPQGSFVLKKHMWGTVTRSARMLLREPTARRCASIASFLIERGVPTPQPRLCLVHGLGLFSHSSYLLTDFIEGTSLFHYIRENSLPTEVVRDLACQVAAIWQQLIELSVSHNDLKPENFLIDNVLRVWIIDFEKLRIHRDEAQLRRRHLEDARIFLHVRNWRDQPESADIFLEELLKTSLGKWLAASGNATLLSLCKGYEPNELGHRISVAIVAEDRSAEPQQLARTIESIRDMADEIVLVGPATADGQFEVREIIQPDNFDLDRSSRPRLHGAGHLPAGQLQHPWVLVLFPGECATPDLVRQLPECIVDHTNCDAVKVYIDEFLFGRSTRRYCRGKTTSIRLFRQGRCRFSLQDNSLTVTADPDRVQISKVRIQHHIASGLDDYVKQLNQQTTRSAMVLCRQGRSPNLLAGLARATRQFLREYFLQGRYRSGRVGLQMALLGATFVLIEQAKLRQFHANNRTLHEPIAGPDRGLPSERFDDSGRDHVLPAASKTRAA